jgi:CheY-like chemotaxis protein
MNTSEAPVTRVLVVEDNIDAAEDLSTILDLWGVDADVVYSADMALRALSEGEPYALVLTDIGLPGKDGYALLKEIRGGRTATTNIGTPRDVPVVAVSGYGSAEDRDRMARAGFSEVLAKPIDPEWLVSVLQRYTGCKPGGP